MKQQNVQWHWGSGDLLWDSCFISDYKGKIVPSVQPGWQRITTLSLPAPSLSAISPNSPLWPGWGAKPQDLALRPTREFLSGQFEAGFCHSTSPPVSRGSGTLCESSLTDFPPWIMAWPPSSQAFWDHDVVKSHSLAGSGLINTRLIFGSTKGRVYWPNPVPGEDESKSPFAFTKVSFSNYLHPCSAPGHEKRCWALLSHWGEGGLWLTQHLSGAILQGSLIPLEPGFNPYSSSRRNPAYFCWFCFSRNVKPICWLDFSLDNYILLT